jgi:hypothetical protein
VRHSAPQAQVSGALSVRRELDMLCEYRYRISTGTYSMCAPFSDTVRCQLDNGSPSFIPVQRHRSATSLTPVKTLYRYGTIRVPACRKIYTVMIRFQLRTVPVRYRFSRATTLIGSERTATNVPILVQGNLCFFFTDQCRSLCVGTGTGYTPDVLRG